MTIDIVIMIFIVIFLLIYHDNYKSFRYNENMEGMMTLEFQVETYTGKYIQKTNNHLYIAPSEALKDIVAHYTITFQNPNHSIGENQVLHLIPDVSGCFFFKFYDPLSIMVWGPTTKIVTVKNDLNTFPCRFFVEFLPGGLYQVLGQSIDSLLDKKIELSIMNSKLYQTITKAIEQMNTFDEMVDFIDMLLCREVAKNNIPEIILESLKLIETHHGQLSILELTNQLHKSERQLNRYFHQYIGMGIKKYSRIVNVNHLIQEINQKNLLDLTYEYDYFDQSHFNHVFKQICETTPTHYLQNMSDFYNELYKFSLK